MNNCTSYDMMPMKTQEGYFSCLCCLILSLVNLMYCVIHFLDIYLLPEDVCKNMQKQLFAQDKLCINSFSKSSQSHTVVHIHMKYEFSY